MLEALKTRVKEAQRYYGISSESALYLRLMTDQFLNGSGTSQQLKIRERGSEEGNFRLGVDMKPEDRRKRLRRYDLSEIDADPENATMAKSFSFVVNLLHGGVGENLGRKVWLKLNSGRETLGAKGTDLGTWGEAENGRREFVSDAELQLARNIQEAGSGNVGRIIFQPLVNRESAQSFKDLFDKTIFLDDRLNPSGPQRTYRQAAREMGLLILDGRDEMLFQDDLPGLDESQGRSASVIPLEEDGYKQTGGHGQWGVFFMVRAKEGGAPRDPFTGHFRVFGNGDNANAGNYPQVAGFMRRHRIAVVQLNTLATPADRKGGKTGERFDPQSQKWVPDQMELAQAKASGQEKYFVNAGQAPGEEQDFNMNGYLMDEDVLRGLLNDLNNAVGDEEYLRIIGPTYVPKGGKLGKNGSLRIPIDGTIGSVMHNMNAWFITDPRGEAILKRSHLDAFLGYVHCPRDGFAATKTPFDKYAHAYSDAYYTDFKSKRILLAPGATPAEVELHAPKHPGYWNELQVLVDNFGRLKIKALRNFYVDGAVKLRDATLAGIVQIKCESPEEIDLNDSRYRDQFAKADLFHNGTLVLKDVALSINEHGNLSIDSKNVDSRASDMARRLS